MIRKIKNFLIEIDWIKIVIFGFFILVCMVLDNLFRPFLGNIVVAVLAYLLIETHLKLKEK